ELVAQVADVRTQGVGVATVRPPNVRVEAVGRYDVAGVGDEQIEDPELGRRQPAHSVAPRDFVCLRVEDQTVCLDLRLANFLLTRLRAAEDRADAGDELPELEGLREEIIG